MIRLSFSELRWLIRSCILIFIITQLKLVFLHRFFSLPKNRSSGRFYDSRPHCTNLPVSRCTAQSSWHWSTYSSSCDFHSFNQSCEEYHWLIQWHSQDCCSTKCHFSKFLFFLFANACIVWHNQQEDKIWCTFHCFFITEPGCLLNQRISL